MNIFIKRLIPTWEDEKKQCANKEKVLLKIAAKPWLELIPRFVELMGEKSSVSNLLMLITKVSKLEKVELKSIVDELMNNQFLTIKVGGGLGSSFRFFDTMPLKAIDHLKIRRYWQDIMTDYSIYRKAKGESLMWGYKLFTCNLRQIEDIKKSYMTFYNSIDEILRECDESDNCEADKLQLYALNIQLIDLIKALDINDELKKVHLAK